ncbi:MAG: phosphatase PAP2 family protein [Rickettsiales bacterium]|jgi:membrane-associated phospholipid phosphatase|nr:phosphatase PAP2 family protein [Rickettsiales bacterium]
MFLAKDNSIKWKRVAWAFALTAVLCLVGILWLDKPLYIFFREFDWYGWVIFDMIFSHEIWLFTSGVIFVILLVKKYLKTINKTNKKTIKFNIWKIIGSFIEKSKTNYGFLIFCSILLSGVFTGILKFVLGRARPVFFEALGQTGFYPWTKGWAFNSMPSGHASASFAGLVMIGMLFPRIKWATWTLAVVIGISRICYGAHFPSDVLLGAFIGMLSADIIKSFFRVDKK